MRQRRPEGEAAEAREEGARPVLRGGRAEEADVREREGDDGWLLRGEAEERLPGGDRGASVGGEAAGGLSTALASHSPLVVAEGLKRLRAVLSRPDGSDEVSRVTESEVVEWASWCASAARRFALVSGAEFVAADAACLGAVLVSMAPQAVAEIVPESVEDMTRCAAALVQGGSARGEARLPRRFRVPEDEEARRRGRAREGEGASEACDGACARISDAWDSTSRGAVGRSVVRAAAQGALALSGRYRAWDGEALAVERRLLDLRTDAEVRAVAASAGGGASVGSPAEALVADLLAQRAQRVRSAGPPPPLAAFLLGRELAADVWGVLGESQASLWSVWARIVLLWALLLGGLLLAVVAAVPGAPSAHRRSYPSSTSPEELAIFHAADRARFGPTDLPSRLAQLAASPGALLFTHLVRPLLPSSAHALASSVLSAAVAALVLALLAVLALRVAANTFAAAASPQPPALPLPPGAAESAAALAALSAAQAAVAHASEPDLAAALRRFLLRARAIDLAECPLPPRSLHADDFLPSPLLSRPLAAAHATDPLPRIPEVDALIARATVVARDVDRPEGDEDHKEQDGEGAPEDHHGAPEDRHGAKEDRHGAKEDRHGAGEGASEDHAAEDHAEEHRSRGAAGGMGAPPPGVPVPGDLLDTLRALERRLAGAERSGPSDEQARALLERVQGDIAWLERARAATAPPSS
jgi:hypothetical protein